MKKKMDILKSIEEESVDGKELALCGLPNKDAKLFILQLSHFLKNEKIKTKTFGEYNMTIFFEKKSVRIACYTKKAYAPTDSIILDIFLFDKLDFNIELIAPSTTFHLIFPDYEIKTAIGLKKKEKYLKCKK